MSEEEKFDDLLRSKLTERDFPFDEHNWDKVEPLIERNENRRKFIRFGIVLFTGIAIGILCMLPFVNSNKNAGVNKEQPVTVNNSSPNQPIAAQQTPATNTTDNNNSTTTHHPTTEGISNNSQPALPVNDYNAGLVNSATKNPQTPVVASGAKKHHADKITTSSTPEQYSYVRPAKEKHQRKAAKQNISSTNLASNSNSPAEFIPTDNSALNTKQPTTSNNSTSQLVNNAPAANNNSTNNSSSNTTNSTATNNNSPANTAIDNNTTANTQPVATNNPSNNPTAANQNNTTVANNSTTKAADSAAMADSMNAAAPTFEPPKKSGYFLTTLSIDAGATCSLGWQKAGGTQGNGFNELFGLSLTHYFSSTISALMGVQFNKLSNMNTLYTVSNGQYDFGMTTSVNSVTLKTLYYVAVPVRVQYCFGFKNLISIGANVLYLVNTNSNVVSYNQNYFGVSGYTSTDKTGYMDGLNTLDIQAALAYRRKLFGHFIATAEFYYGLLDIEQNSFFNDNTFERNSGFKLILSYDLIK